MRTILLDVDCTGERAPVCFPVNCYQRHLSDGGCTTRTFRHGAIACKREAGLKLVFEVCAPGSPLQLDLCWPLLSPVMDVEKEVYKSCCVVHPAKAENNVGMEGGQSNGLILNHGRDQDSKGGDEDRRRLRLHGLELVQRNLSVTENTEDGKEAK